jgi:hypothetical protein
LNRYLVEVASFASLVMIDEDAPWILPDMHRDARDIFARVEGVAGDSARDKRVVVEFDVRPAAQRPSFGILEG